MGTELTAVESKTLTRCEGIINRGIGTFREVGEALMKIRDDKLYRASDATFQGYCERRWEFTASRARQLISAAKTAESVTNVTLPNEAAARELAKAEPEDRQKVVEWLEEKGVEPTAANIREAVAEFAVAEPEDEPDPDAYAGDTDTPPPPEHVNHLPTHEAIDSGERNRNKWLVESVADLTADMSDTQAVAFSEFLRGLAVYIRETNNISIAAAAIENAAG